MSEKHEFYRLVLLTDKQPIGRPDDPKLRAYSRLPANVPISGIFKSTRSWVDTELEDLSKTFGGFITEITGGNTFNARRAVFNFEQPTKASKVVDYCLHTMIRYPELALKMCGDEGCLSLAEDVVSIHRNNILARVGAVKLGAPHLLSDAQIIEVRGLEGNL